MKTTLSPLRRLSDVIDRLVDQRVGIVGSVNEVLPGPGEPCFFHFSAQACNTRAFSRQANFRSTGGASTNRDLAVAKAVGEAVERYCAALYEVDELPLHSAGEAGEDCAQPGSFALSSAEQYQSPGFPWVPFDQTTPVRWTPTTDLTTGGSCLVPACMVWIPYHFYQGTGDTPITQPISTGLACHCSRSEAALAGLYEVIERDAFTIMWQSRMACPQVRIETLSDANYDIVQRFERTGDSVVLLDITLDARVPTILSVLRGNSTDRPAYVFAASANLDPEQAVRKALEELAHTRRYSQQIARRLPRLANDPEYANVVEQVDHLNLYCDPANASLCEFVFASQKRVEFEEIEYHSSSDPAADLARAAASVASTGHRVLAADLTSPDVAELGLHVVRVVVPGYHPLFMGHRIRSLGGNRLWSVPQALGHPGVSRASGDNPAPHPYP